ncbi:MAG TPA: complex I subunit 1 family protein, partial [Candidatus Acidoferrum sp.]
ITQATMDFVRQYWAPLVCSLAIVAVLPLVAGYIVLVERKIMADMQARLGPMRVGPHGLLQPIADAVKLLIKEDIIPEDADKLVFWLAPVLSVAAALLAMAGLAIGPAFQIAKDINIGILFVVGVSAMGIFGIVLGGWASNSHYSLIGALRSSAQLVSYETAAGMALVCGLLFAGTLNITSIVQAQYEQGIWFGLLAPVAFFTYLVASIAETNRAPFDLPEAESELVAGYMTEFSGFRWSLYFLAEYTNMIVVASVATTLFLGGWLRPFPRTAWLHFLDFLPPLLMIVIGFYCLMRTPKQPVLVQRFFMFMIAGLCFGVALVLAAPMLVPAVKPFHDAILGAFWFIFKVGAYIYFFMWLRFTLPRYRFDQLMRLGWHFLIPLSIINVLLIGIAMIAGQYFHLAGWSLLLTTIPASIVALLIALFILATEQKSEPQKASGAAPDSYA